MQGIKYDETLLVYPCRPHLAVPMKAALDKHDWYEGIENRWERHARLCPCTAESAKALGLELAVNTSNVLTAIKAPKAWMWIRLLKAARRKTGQLTGARTN